MSTTLIHCEVVAGRSSTPSSSSSSQVSPEDGFSNVTVHRHPRKYHNSISTQSSSSLERTSTSSGLESSGSSEGSEACLSRAEKDVQTEMDSEEDSEEESETSESEVEDVAVKPRRKNQVEANDYQEDSFIDQPFATSWGFANGTQRDMISSVVGDKAPVSNVEQMEDWELEIVERAHRESRLAEYYSDPAWRFYTHPPTSFLLPRVAMRHGLTGDEGMSVWSEWAMKNFFITKKPLITNLITISRFQSSLARRLVVTLTPRPSPRLPSRLQMNRHW